MTAKTKLFCLPYAGGSAENIYNNWKHLVDKNIEVCPVELAGRGSRITEDFYASLDEAIDDIFYQIEKDIRKGNYALFGHSMGAFLSYELIQKIHSLKLPKPKHAFFSGRKPPGMRLRKKPFAEMDSEEFKKNVIALGATPPQLFEYPELRKIFLPILRSDFSLSETIVSRAEISPMDINITVLIGKNEDITQETADKWNFHTHRKCTIQYIEGGHFFLLENPKKVVEIINNCLNRNYFINI